MLTGRKIQVVELSAAAGDQETQLDLRSCKAGLYNCALLIDDKPAGNRKLSVMK